MSIFITNLTLHFFNEESSIHMESFLINHNYHYAIGYLVCSFFANVAFNLLAEPLKLLEKVQL